MHDRAGDFLAAYRAVLEKDALPPSYPGDRGEIDRLVRLPSGKREPPAEDLPFLTPPQLERQARDLAEELGIKFGHLVHPVRAALTGTTKGPGLFDMVFLLGKEKCLERLSRTNNGAKSPA